MPSSAKTFKLHDDRGGRGPSSQAAQALTNSKAWRRLAKAFLAVHLLCVECERQGRERFADHVDHIVPHRGNPDLFWDESNLQGLCHSCHSCKTARGE